VTWSPGSGSKTVTGTSDTITGLTADTEYTINVVATDSTGAHSDSPAATITATTAAS
jgi:chitodextrinase